MAVALNITKSSPHQNNMPCTSTKTIVKPSKCNNSERGGECYNLYKLCGVIDRSATGINFGAGFVYKENDANFNASHPLSENE